MNLLDHVLGIRLLIHRAFDGKFERLGIMNDGFVDMQLSDEDIQLRKRIKGIIYTNLPEQNDDHTKARDYTLKQCVFTLFNRLAAIKCLLKYIGMRNKAYQFLYMDASDSVKRLKEPRKQVHGMSKEAVKALLAAPNPNKIGRAHV